LRAREDFLGWPGLMRRPTGRFGGGLGGHCGSEILSRL
jgi:hypothetical protein